MSVKERRKERKREEESYRECELVYVHQFDTLECVWEERSYVILLDGGHT